MTLREKQKQLDEISIADILNITNETDKRLLLKRLEDLTKNNKLLNKPFSGRNSYYLNPEKNSIDTDTYQNNENESTVNVDIQIKRINDKLLLLNAEMTALKSFVMEQFFVIKKSIQDITLPNNDNQNFLYISLLTDQVNYLMEENKTKTLFNL